MTSRPCRNGGRHLQDRDDAIFSIVCDTLLRFAVVIIDISG
jgi:hypothetical protein